MIISTLSIIALFFKSDSPSEISAKRMLVNESRFVRKLQQHGTIDQSEIKTSFR
jgi:hypothetical protein